MELELECPERVDACGYIESLRYGTGGRSSTFLRDCWLMRPLGGCPPGGVETDCVLAVAGLVARERIVASWSREPGDGPSEGDTAEMGMSPSLS
jgi:hypothetical protein